MSKKEAERYYGKNGPMAYSEIVQDFHRSRHVELHCVANTVVPKMYELMDFILCTLANTRWQAGDWTDDTDQLLLILQMIVERGGSVDKCVFAGKMRHWRHKGFPELEDVGRPYTSLLHVIHVYTY